MPLSMRTLPSSGNHAAQMISSTKFMSYSGQIRYLPSYPSSEQLYSVAMCTYSPNCLEDTVNNEN